MAVEWSGVVMEKGRCGSAVVSSVGQRGPKRSRASRCFCLLFTRVRCLLSGKTARDQETRLRKRLRSVVRLRGAHMSRGLQRLLCSPAKQPRPSFLLLGSTKGHLVLCSLANRQTAGCLVLVPLLVSIPAPTVFSLMLSLAKMALFLDVSL